MKLIFLYGPPAAGKLTIATELAKRTHYKMLHNHLTIEVVKSLFAHGTPAYIKTLQEFRFALLEAAAKRKVPGVITTYVYAAKHDDAEIKELLRRMKKYGVSVYFVQIICDQRLLEKRVGHRKRQKFSKIHSRHKLQSIMKKYNVVAKIPFGKNMTIDTAKMLPAVAAKKIATKLGL